MKKLYSLITLVILLSVAFKASAQSDDDGFSQLIKSSPADAGKLVGAYAKPLFKGFGVGLNSGWNNTALTKKFLHFDIRITAAVAEAPTMDKTFDINQLGLSNHLKAAPGSSSIAQTFAGNKDAVNPTVNIYNDNGNSSEANKIGSFVMPKAIIQYVPAPNIQFTIGLVKNTDLTIRSTPTIKISDDAGSVGVFGFGLKHDLIQDFAKKGKPKPFDLALAVNYNRLKYTKSLSVQPDAGALPAPGQNPADFSTQQVSATFSGFNVQAIISKKLLFFTPFASVAYQTAKTDMGILGNFPLQSTVPGQVNRYIVVTDPIHINETSISGIRTDFGFQMNLLILRIYASYSMGGGYNSANAGVGLGF